jgi:hypothetical protein
VDPADNNRLGPNVNECMGDLTTTLLSDDFVFTTTVVESQSENYKRHDEFGN